MTIENLRKTGYERTCGLDGGSIHVCMTGVFLSKDHRNEVEYDKAAYCKPVNREEVEISKEWLKKCAKNSI